MHGQTPREFPFSCRENVRFPSLQVVTFGLEQLSGQVYRVFKLTRYMLPVDGRGHKVPHLPASH